MTSALLLAAVCTLRGDLLLRGEAVRDTPNPAFESFERVRLRLRPGFEAAFADGAITFGARAVVSAASDANAENRAKFDNFRSDAAAVDRLFLRITPPGASLAVTLGKFRNPYLGGELTWDADIQPEGAAFQLDLPRAQRVVGGVFLRSQLYGDRSRIAIAQWSGDLAGGTQLALGYQRYDKLEGLISGRLARTNRLAAGGAAFVSDYRLVDVLVRHEWVGGRRPLRVQLELVHNLGARDRNDALELRLRYGQVRQLGDWSLRYAFQRVEQDAVVAAFTPDEWWFHSNQRGHLLGVGLGLGRDVVLEIFALAQRRDDLDTTLARYVVDVTRSF
ncbi:MAG TPA: putative porin [Candidatus Polarisedimenticolaceae bacterium]|nr:putative porin [Candidatus Polarisedimenticolaceae bacterium]